MRIGLSIDPPLAAIPGVLAGEGVDCFQTVLRDPGRFGNDGVPEPADRAALVDGLRRRPAWGVAHGSLLVNLASPEGRIRNSSVSSLLADLIAVDDGIAMAHEGMLSLLPSRELIADAAGDMVNAHCAGALVCISNCDKITPGMLMAALRLNLPTIFVAAPIASS
jgi:hypothetical protein